MALSSGVIGLFPPSRPINIMAIIANKIARSVATLVRFILLKRFKWSTGLEVNLALNHRPLTPPSGSESRLPQALPHADRLAA